MEIEEEAGEEEESFDDGGGLRATPEAEVQFGGFAG
jgi:hypothetical protein